MSKPKVSANADRLDDIYLAWLRLGASAPTFGEYAAKHSVLAVCAATVPDDLDCTDGFNHAKVRRRDLRTYLCRLARGAK